MKPLNELKVFGLIQIILCHHFRSFNESGHSFCWDLSKDFILPIALAIFAGAMAYYIFISETERDKDNEKRVKEQERSDKLLFFSALLESVLRTSTQQRDNIENHIKAIQKNDVDFLLMTFLPLDDLKRVTEVLNLEVYLLAYVNHYSADRKKSVKEFKEITASIDFLYLIFNQITLQLEKGSIYDHERKQNFQKLFAEAYQLIGELLFILEKDPVLLNELQKPYGNFFKNHPGRNDEIAYYYEYLIVPVNDFCTNYIGTLEARQSKGETPIQEILTLAVITRDAKQAFDTTKFNNRELAQGLANDLLNINSAIKDLTDTTINILKDF